MQSLNVWKSFNSKHKIKNFIRKFKYSYQRITRGYSDYDLWDFNEFIIEIIINGIPDFISINIHSLPVNLTEDQWKDKLDTLQESFIQYEEALEQNITDINEFTKLKMKAFENLYECFEDLWD